MARCSALAPARSGHSGENDLPPLERPIPWTFLDRPTSDPAAARARMARGDGQAFGLRLHARRILRRSACRRESVAMSTPRLDVVAAAAIEVRGDRAVIRGWLCTGPDRDHRSWGILRGRFEGVSRWKPSSACIHRRVSSLWQQHPRRAIARHRHPSLTSVFTNVSGRGRDERTDSHSVTGKGSNIRKGKPKNLNRPHLWLPGGVVRRMGETSDHVSSTRYAFGWATGSDEATR